jgi:hypothetical protein
MYFLSTGDIQVFKFFMKLISQFHREPTHTEKGQIKFDAWFQIC